MADETLAYVANYHPPVGHLIHQTGMVPIMTEMMDDPNQEYVADGGTAVAGMIQNPAELTILDDGGDDVGVTVLAALGDFLSKREVHMVQVINPFRPFTETIEGCIQIKEEIEASSKLKITSLVSNANLIDETTPEHIIEGYRFIQAVSKTTGLPIEFITASSQMIPALDMNQFHCPVLTIDRQLVFPWTNN